MDWAIGLGGFPGLDKNPARHIQQYAERHPDVGIALGDLGHDATAALVAGGKIRFAVEEERLNRSKHFMGLAEAALAACRRHADGGEGALAYYLDPDEAERAARVAACRKIAADVGPAVEREFADAQAWVRAARDRWPSLRPVNHHLAHAASAFLPSPFDTAAVLVLDGQGESASVSLYRGEGTRLTLVASLPVTSSLGYLYSNVTGFLGFEPIEDEYKIMGLAAYGTGDEHRAFFDEEIRLEDGGGFSVPSLLVHPMKRLFAWSRKLGTPRRPETPIEDRHIAVACSLQRALERSVLRFLEAHLPPLGSRNLCLAGGVALNCTMNGVLDRSGLFDRIFVQPAAGDPGAALGAALLADAQNGARGERHAMSDVYLGPEFGAADVEAAIAEFRGSVAATRPADYTGEVARRIADGEVVGWYQGRMEFGPRALGNRSILADARRADMKDRVNRAVKKREEFRPFAPSVTAEGAETFFELRAPKSQYAFMTIAVPARASHRDQIPSVVHVNGTARVQVVARETNPRYWELITRFGERTGVPVVMNTSFNVRGEPIVCTPADAIRCFLGTQLDALALDGWVVTRKPD